MGRTYKYQESHPWVTFSADLNRLTHVTWMLLGEAESKCQHIAGVPLKPAIAQQLHEIYLTKGIHGTTSIEGNTLSEAEVRQLVRGELELPPSREYLGREVDNILAACNDIVADVEHRRPLELTPARIKDFNRLVLRGLDTEDDTTRPGEIRTHSVTVARYRGAPAEDCEHLLERLCKWLDGPDFDPPNGALGFTMAILKAVLAHLYIAWIHPFADGNGRTARLMEFQLLVQAGVPLPAAHLLSDHYNLTRDQYYLQLDRTSKPPYPIEGFVQYALQGFVDELRSQLQVIREHQMQVTWENYVHGSFHGKETKARIRQKHLVLDLSPDVPVPSNGVRDLSPRLAREYADKGPRTVPRDINALLKMGLIRRVRGGIVANRAIIQAFLPLKAEADEQAGRASRHPSAS